MQLSINELMESGFCLLDREMIQAYTPHLLETLGSTNSDDRENSLTILSTWIEGHRYTDEQYRSMAEQMLPNLSLHIGEAEEDGVFLRAFSALILGEIIEHDQAAEAEGAAYLEEKQFHAWLPTILDCFTCENDLRGFVPVKGWAHSMAHFADLLLVICQHRYCTTEEMQNILNVIAAKIIQPANRILQYQEDERLAKVAADVLSRNCIDETFWQQWAQSFYHLQGDRHWTAAFALPEENRARYNARAFLRSLYFQLTIPQNKPAHSDMLCAYLLKALQEMDCGRFYPATA